MKKRKEERAIERELWEQEKMRLAREREAADYADWESKEEEVLCFFLSIDFSRWPLYQPSLNDVFLFFFCSNDIPPRVF